MRDLLDHRQVVRDEQVGQAQLLLQPLEQREDLRLHQHVERGDRLVEQDQPQRSRVGQAGEEGVRRGVVVASLWRMHAVQLALKAIARGFALAVQISAPFIAFGILFNLGLGVLSRLMPQFQVFFLGMPASILIGMLILAGSLGVLMSVFLDDIGRYLAEFAGR